MSPLPLPKILLVDDVLVNIKVLEHMLKGPEQEIFSAQSGAEAIAMMELHDFAVVLLDVNMPDLDGFDTLKKMRENPETKFIPVILVTATIKDEAFISKGYRCGAVDYLVKPIRPEIVKSKVRVFLDLYAQKKRLEITTAELKHEVASRIETETRLRESQEQFKSLSDNSPDIIYTLDAEGRFSYVNPAWKEILGHDPSEILHKPFIDFVREEEVITYKTLFRRIRDDKQTFRNISGQMIHQDGTLRDFSLSGAPNRVSDSDSFGMVGLLRDVTQQKKLQAQLLHSQKMEAVGTLAGGIAHDFNNLLQAIQGYTELVQLLQPQDIPGVQELAEIKKAAQRGAQLTQQLLTFSRKSESKPKPILLNHEVKHIHRLLKRTIPKMIEIVIDLDDSIGHVSADPIRMEQVLMNLGLNARDAMPDGGTLTIRTRSALLDEAFCRENMGSIPGNYACLSIQDTGSGIPGEMMNHIFEPFFTTKESGKGTGLGLAIVYGIVKNHGGYITCKSKKNQGTIFDIYWPVIQSTENQEEKQPAPKITGGKETILIVDDEPYILRVGSQVLGKYGYTVITAANGPEAIGILEGQKAAIDLVILDMIMPKMGGKQCLDHLLGINPGLKVIIVSGYAYDLPEESDIKSKVWGYIHKPYETSHLLKTIRDTLDEVKHDKAQSTLH